MMQRHRFLSLFLSFALAFGLGACGGDSSPSDPSPDVADATTDATTDAVPDTTTEVVSDPGGPVDSDDSSESIATEDVAEETTDLGPPPDPCPTDNPVYIMAYAHHYLGGGGIYPRAADIDALRTAVEETQIPATFFLDGILVAELLAEDASIFSRLTNSAFLELGYHGEETHGPYPVPIAAFNMDQSLTAGMTWDEAFAAASDFASFARSYSFLDSNAEIREVDRFTPWVQDDVEPGGVKLLRDTVLGQPLAIATYHGLVSPPVQLAFMSIAPVAVLQGTVPVSSHGIQNNVPEPGLIADLLALGGPQDLFYYMGSLQTKEVAGAELNGDLANIQQQLADLERSRPRFVTLNLIMAPGDASDVSEILSYIKDEFLPANPGSHFIRPQELLNWVEPIQVAPVDIAGLKALAQAVSTLFINNGIPNMVTANDRTYSLSEAFEILAGGLAHYNQTGSFPESVTVSQLLGPIGDPHDVDHVVMRSRPIQQVLDAASTALQTIETDISATRPARIPFSNPIDDEAINSAELLRVMADTVLKLDEGSTPTDSVDLNPSYLVPPYSDHLDLLYDQTPTSLPLWYAKLQLWSVKPAHFNCGL